MTYTSLKSPENRDYTYDLNVAHLYGNLLNTYGDNGNVLMIKYVGEKLGAKMTFDIVSVGDDFDKDHYTLNQENNRYIGDIKIHNEEFDETYYGFENHQGRTFLSDDEKPLGKVVYGNGNNKEDGTEGVHYKNVYGSYFHGPILSRNANLAYRLVTTALRNKYGQDISLPSYDDILSSEVAEEYADTKSKAEFEK